DGVLRRSDLVAARLLEVELRRQVLLGGRGARILQQLEALGEDLVSDRQTGLVASGDGDRDDPVALAPPEDHPREALRGGPAEIPGEAMDARLGAELQLLLRLVFV